MREQTSICAHQRESATKVLPSGLSRFWSLSGEGFGFVGLRKIVKVGCVGGFAGAEHRDELPVGLGANPQELVVHGGERVRAEIVDLLQVAEFQDDLFKSGVQPVRER